MSKKKQDGRDAVKIENDELNTAPAQDSGQQPEQAGSEASADQQTYTLTAEEFETAKAHIAKLQKEKDETVTLLQRNQADFDNFRRRNATIRADSYEEGKRECIKQLLPALDNFDRALESDGAGSDGDGWREGVCMACRQLHELLGKLGMEEVDASGKFDPNLHEAVMQEQVEGKESGEILAVLQKGYRVGDKIIRHSMVKVAQ